MPENKLLVCDHCRRSVEAWAEGHPYYRDDSGRKRYAYHPDHENLARCKGNDVPHICISCGTERKVDSLEPDLRCRKCQDDGLIETWDLEGQTCPFCRRGIFQPDPGFHRSS